MINNYDYSYPNFPLHIDISYHQCHFVLVHAAKIPYVNVELVYRKSFKYLQTSHARYKPLDHKDNINVFAYKSYTGSSCHTDRFQRTIGTFQIL